MAQNQKDIPSSSSPPEQASPQAGLLPFEQQAALQGVSGWQLAAVAAQKNWPAGLEVSAETFRSAHDETLKGVIE